MLIFFTIWAALLAGLVSCPSLSFCPSAGCRNRNAAVSTSGTVNCHQDGSVVMFPSTFICLLDSLSNWLVDDVKMRPHALQYNMTHCVPSMKARSRRACDLGYAPWSVMKHLVTQQLSTTHRVRYHDSTCRVIKHPTTFSQQPPTDISITKLRAVPIPTGDNDRAFKKHQELHRRVMKKAAKKQRRADVIRATRVFFGEKRGQTRKQSLREMRGELLSTAIAGSATTSSSSLPSRRNPPSPPPTSIARYPTLPSAEKSYSATLQRMSLEELGQQIETHDSLSKNKRHTLKDASGSRIRMLGRDAAKSLELFTDCKFLGSNVNKARGRGNVSIYEGAQLAAAASGVGPAFIREEAFRTCDIYSSNFIGSFVDTGDLPRLGLPEVALVGRSNSGKSTLINTLFKRVTCRRKQNPFKKITIDTAKVSKTPGKTRMINIFELANAGRRGLAALVDLPGYGYTAGIPKREKTIMESTTIAYLNRREELRLLILLIDSGLGVRQQDAGIVSMLRKLHVPYLVVATKTDTVQEELVDEKLGEIQTDLELPSWMPVPTNFVTRQNTLD
eukprot:GHVQ01023064.1.p1 GENE.GHVQ01023064.1~~GHVQ01023064.1.p1  ORF type:complete len:560 (+),score=58.97 GHVQ01023064.1:419-2098(+)